MNQTKFLKDMVDKKTYYYETEFVNVLEICDFDNILSFAAWGAKLKAIIKKSV